MLKDEYPEEYKLILDTNGNVSKFNMIKLAMKLKIQVGPQLSVVDMDKLIVDKLNNLKNGSTEIDNKPIDPLKEKDFDENNVKNIDIYNVYKSIKIFHDKVKSRHSKNANIYLSNTLQDDVLNTTEANIHNIVDVHKLQEWQDILDMGFKSKYGVSEDNWNKLEYGCKFALARLSHLL